MPYKIEYAIDLEKALRKIPLGDAKAIKEKIEGLTLNPRPVGSIKLSGKDFYRIRSGKYRIIYKIFDDRLVVLILDADQRKNVYNNL